MCYSQAAGAEETADNHEEDSKSWRGRVEIQSHLRSDGEGFMVEAVKQSFTLAGRALRSISRSLCLTLIPFCPWARKSSQRCEHRDLKLIKTLTIHCYSTPLPKNLNANVGICQGQSLKELYFIVQRVLEIPRRREEENRETDGGWGGWDQKSCFTQEKEKNKPQ